MSILCDHEIHDLAQRAGLVEPYSPALVNPASLDVRLGTEVLLESRYQKDWVPYSLEAHTEDAPYSMMPGEFLLACTLETFRLPGDLAAHFNLKSTRARGGLQHLLSGYCDPGWHGSKLTLELHNSRRFAPVPLWPGMRIGQLIFHRLSSIPERDYSVTGRYNNDPTVMSAKP